MAKKKNYGEPIVAPIADVDVPMEGEVKEEEIINNEAIEESVQIETENIAENVTDDVPTEETPIESEKPLDVKEIVEVSLFHTTYISFFVSVFSEDNNCIWLFGAISILLESSISFKLVD